MYVTNWHFHLGLSQYLMQPMESPFNGTLTGEPFSTDETLFGMFWGSGVVQEFFDADKVEFESVKSKFENITDSLTTFMRENGVANLSKPASKL